MDKDIIWIVYSFADTSLNFTVFIFYTWILNIHIQLTESHWEYILKYHVTMVSKHDKYEFENTYYVGTLIH